MVGFTGGEAKTNIPYRRTRYERNGSKNRINKIRNNTACLNHKNAWKDMKTAVIKTVGAALFGITVLGAARMTPYAFNIGPGMEDHDIIYYQEQPENNPAYNNGWTSNVGPERPVPIREAVLAARKITCTRKARETRRHSSTQNRKQHDLHPQYLPRRQLETAG